MTGFVPVEGSYPPRFKQVPEAMKFPRGPYKQAPPDWGSEWWYVPLGPFGGSAMPWERHVTKPPVEETYPDGFLETFGPRPQAEDFVGTDTTYQEAIIRWNQDLKYFKQAGLPDFITTQTFQLASDIFQSWGMGRPRPYEGRYGWMVRFPNSALRFFEAPIWAVINWTHGVIAQYQTQLITDGIEPEQIHPFVPQHLRPKGD